MTIYFMIEEQAKAFGDWLRAKRLEKGFTMPQLAAMLETNKQTIYRFEKHIAQVLTNKPTLPKREFVIAAAKALGEDPSEPLAILGYASETNYPPEFARQFNRLNELTKDLPEDEREKAIREFKTLVDFFLHKYKKD
jgi:transcriptional regulator with XRE-family HTH domain